MTQCYDSYTAVIGVIGYSHNITPLLLPHHTDTLESLYCITTMKSTHNLEPPPTVEVPCKYNVL